MPNPESRALIFDLDGTLADTMPAHFIAWTAALARHGLSLSEDRFYELGGWPTTKIVRLLAEERGMTLDVETFAELKEAEFLRAIGEIGPVPPVMDIVRREHGRTPMAVATSAVRDVAERILRQIDAVDYFDALVVAEDVPRHKPEPDVFLEAARRLGVLPEACCVYEDSEPGIEAARRAGMTWVDVRTLFTPRRVTDWRLQGQERYLHGTLLFHKPYSTRLSKTDHDHCEFCGKKFSASPNDAHEGYATSDEYRWVCDECFEDFCERFEWKVASS
ncbi:MAG: HAD-IA family hydrolase [Pirellulales bacterium]